MSLPRGVNALLTLLLVLLVIGLAVLAVLQYRWIDRVSEAERQRMQANLDFAARRFADDLRAEVGALFETFARAEGGDPAFRYQNWERGAAHPRLAAEVFVIERGEGGWAVRRLDRQTRQLVDTDWPPVMERVREQIEDDEAWGGRIRWPPPFISSVPALFISPRRGPPGAFEPPSDQPPTAVFVRLDRAELMNAVVPRIAKQHFSGDHLALLQRDQVLYRSQASWPDGRTPADVEVPFRLIDEPKRGPGPPQRFEAEIEPWRLAVRRADGGLETLVAATRRRNLAISFAILFILAGTVVLLLALLRRADRLRAQQTEFVAAMTHELNTPIAALRSAGENLKDGIVAERERQVRYGETIVKESARLGDMVAQVLDFAGMQARGARAQDERVDVAAVVGEAVAQCRWLVDGTAIDVETSVDAGLPPVRGDAVALTRAVQNLVANAIRHGGAGNWVGLRAARNGNGGIAITVEDRGPGIDSRDAAHLFEPFYRGKGSARVRGTGLGLAIVQQVARAHGGSVEVDRKRRGGAAFTLHLPAAVDHA